MTSSAAHSPSIHLEQVKLLYRNLNVAIPGNLFVLLAIVWAAWEEREASHLLLLVGAMLIVLLLRYMDGRKFQRVQQLPDIFPADWERRFMVGIGVTGILWGVVFQIVFIPDQPAIVLFVICFYAGLISSSSATTAARFPVFVVFVLPATLPLVFRVFQAGGALYNIMGMAFLVFVTANLLVVRTYSRIIRESIRLRFENVSLIHRLEEAKTVAEKNQHIAEQAVFAKDKFLAAASHDLRQPLHAQGLYLDAMETYVQSRGVEHLQALRRTNAALSNLFNSLLDVSRLNAGIVEAQHGHCHLHDIVLPLHEEFKTRAAEKQLSLTLDCAPNLVAFTDPLLLARILRNLLSNAVRYTGKGGITLACQLTSNDTLKVAVTDTGIGIPETEQANIFDEYYQLDNPERDRSKGLGLGLAIVKKLADLLGLKVTCVSRSGQGSTFALEVPLGDASLLQQMRPANSVASMAGAQVLVIDDEQEILRSMAALLGSWGCQTITAESAGEAVEKITQAGLQPDLIIADYRLRAGQIGAQAITVVRQHCQREVPAMIITGDTSEERLREASASGLYLLHKPVAPGRLRTVMNQLLKQAPIGG